MNKVYKVGIYLRLSREDGDDLESQSISNQRDLIQNYINKQNDLKLIDEYVDDGYSGINFDREQWKKLMNDIFNKKIDTIITKDLSRMGRDHITMGNYIEKEFPEHNIRYIAIDDDIDTLYETPGFEYLQFKLLFNDFFLKDTSKKIRKMIKSKKEQGYYLGWKGIYGYKRDPNNKYKLIVDEEVRSIVERMFELAKDGYGATAIANIFSKEGIPNPSTHANLIRSKKTKSAKLWCSRTIEDLLQNPTYLGHLTQNIRKKVSYKSNKEIRVPKNEWIIIKNTHEAIIDEYTFNIVQELLKRNKNNPMKKHNYLLKGFLKCKECGHSIGINLVKGKNRSYCMCCFYRAHSKFKVCTPHTMNYAKLELAVLKELREIIGKCINVKELENKINNAKKNNNIIDKLTDKITAIDFKINQISNNIDNLYIDKLNEIIDLERYNRLVKRFNDTLIKLKDEKEKIIDELKILNSIKNREEDKKTSNVIDDFIYLKNPSRELIANLIEKIVISEDKTVEIYYKFNIQKYN